MSLKKLVNEITKPLTEDIKIPVSVGDTILTGRFKNKKTKVKSIGKDDYGMPTINGRKVVNFRVAKVDEEGIVSADGTIQGGSKVSKVKKMKKKGHTSVPYGSGYKKVKEASCAKKSNMETAAEYRKRCGPRPLGQIPKINESEVKTIHNLLQKFGNSSKDATDMIKKHYKKVAQKFKGQSPRDKTMAIIGISLLGEANAVKGSKVSKFITGYNLTMKGKKYKEIEFETLGVDNSSKMVKLRILSPKNLFGMEIPVKFQTLRRGPFLKTNTSKKIKEAPRKPRKKGQHRQSSSHSDLYTDENPKGTIHGLKFATVKDATKSVSKIKSSGKSHAHKIQAAVAMEQRAKEMGKKAEAAIYRTYIEKMKRKTKRMREFTDYMYERAPDTQDAMKRYKAGKAGFTDIAHLKAKGLIKRADGTKRKSEMNEEFKFYPKDLHEYIQLPDFPHDDEKEMSIVRKFISTRTDKDVESVANNDEDSFYSIKQYLRKIKVAFHEDELRGIVKQAVPTIRHFKNKFNRKRPFELDGNLDVLGSKTNKTRSYPSGHSTQSMIIGLYASEKFPEHRDGIMEAAKEVGMGRVKAGFHYLSDHIAGQMLGQKMFEMMNKEDYGKAMKEYYEIGTDNYVNYLKDITPGEEKQAEYKQIAEEKKKCPRCGAINETPFDKCHNCGLPHDKFATYDKNEKLNAFGEIDEEAEYQGRKVKLNNPVRGGSKKFYVYVKNEKGNVVKVSFGDATGLDIKRDDPARRKSFRARHNCDNPGPKWKARYWSCKFWEKGKTVTDLMKG